MINVDKNSQIAPGFPRSLDENGITLIEILMVVVIMGILATMAMMGKDIIEKNRLTAASKEFYSDLLKLRMDAMTRSTAANGMGFGIKFNTTQSYATFEFNDTDGDFSYDGTGEESGAAQKSMPVSVTVHLTAVGTTPVGSGNILIYDKRGMVRKNDWTLLSSPRIYIFTSSTVSDRRCISITSVSIREGIWNGATCNPS